MEIGIKFSCNWIRTEPPAPEEVEQLNYWRQELYTLKLIGEGEDGIGYGNISCRSQGDQFIISGAATGKTNRLTNEHYTKVTHFDIDKNYLECKGPIVASSESMTHGTIYKLSPQIHAVIHVHSKSLWEKWLYQIPTTLKEVEYGTPAMAREIIRLYETSQLKQKSVLAMAGHTDGLVSFGRNLEQAFEHIMALSA